MSTAAATPAPAAAPAKSGGVRILGITLNHASNMIFLTQVALFCLYGGCTTFDPLYSHMSDGSFIPGTAQLGSAVQMFQHVFIGLFVFVGLGFLFIQNTRFAWQNVAYSLAIGATTVEWSILLFGFWDMGKETRTVDINYWRAIPLSPTYLTNALYVAATVLVSYGALAGRVSFAQAYGVAFFEVFFATANYIIAVELKVLDVGGTFFVHLFGGVFGLFASMAIANKLSREVSNQSRSKEAGAFALLGLVVLFVTFPVFNSGNVQYLLTRINPTAVAETGALAFRGYFNTVAAMASSIAAAFMVTKANSANGDHFNFWQLQTAAIAGGVAVGATGIFLRNPYGALMLGAAAGVVSVWAQTVLTPSLGKARFHDASGVLAGHVVPAIIGAVASAIAAARATPEQDFSPAQLNALVFDGRNAKEQGGYQIAYAAISLGFALLSGTLTGLFVNLPIFENKAVANADDADEWDGIEGGAAKTAANPVVHHEAAPAPAAPAPAATA